MPPWDPAGRLEVQEGQAAEGILGPVEATLAATEAQACMPVAAGVPHLQMAGEGTGVEARAQEVAAGQHPITGDTRGQILMVMTIQGQQGEPEALQQEALLEAGAAAELVDLVQLDVLAAVAAAATTITGGAAMGCLSAQGMAWSACP